MATIIVLVILAVVLFFVGRPGCGGKCAHE